MTSIGHKITELKVGSKVDFIFKDYKWEECNTKDIVSYDRIFISYRDVHPIFYVAFFKSKNPFLQRSFQNLTREEAIKIAVAIAKDYEEP
jgi:hypothetical protein